MYVASRPVLYQALQLTVEKKRGGGSHFSVYVKSISGNQHAEVFYLEINILLNVGPSNSRSFLSCSTCRQFVSSSFSWAELLRTDCKHFVADRSINSGGGKAVFWVKYLFSTLSVPS